MPPFLPLRRFPAVHTTDVDEAVAIFSRLTTPARFEKIERGARFEWRANQLSLGTVRISAYEYGAGFHARADSVRDIFSTVFPLVDVPSAGFDSGMSVPVVKDRSTWFVSPDRPGGFYVGTGHRTLALTFARSDGEAALAALIGTTANAPLQFEPSLTLSSGVGAWLRRFTQFIADQADAGDAPLDSPIVRARLADSILYGILEGHPHNHSAAIAAARASEPKYIREAAEYIDAHAGEPVRLADLARITGIGARALQLGFQKHRGCTPMDFLRERRMQRARTILLSGTGASVTQIALDCGFIHVGRFSTRYRARFGESPSETRARSPRN